MNWPIKLYLKNKTTYCNFFSFEVMRMCHFQDTQKIGKFILFQQFHLE